MKGVVMSFGCSYDIINTMPVGHAGTQINSLPLTSRNGHASNYMYF